MASTPSASALSAVLRCRGNIWTRNPPNKRPAPPACSLGALRDPPAERNRSNQAPTWEAFLQGEPAAAGGRLAVACKSRRADGKMLRKKDFRELNKSYHPKLSHSPGDAPVLRLAHRLTCDLPGIFKCSEMIHVIKCETHAAAAHIRETAFLKEIGEFPAGAVSVSVTFPRSAGNVAQPPCLVVAGWSTLRSACSSLAALVSELMLLRLAGLWRSSSSSADAPRQHLQHLQQHEDITTDALQAGGQVHTSSRHNSGCGQKITEDRPD